EDGIRDKLVTGVQTCALPISREHGGLIDDCIAAEQSYARADRDEAEERYGDYVDLVETGTELLADLRDNFATTLDEDASDDYTRSEERRVGKECRSRWAPTQL